MSAQPETFYAVRCDFPECGELFEGLDYTYSTDVDSQKDGARDDGWLTDAGPDRGDDYCPTHTVVVDCPAEGMVGDVEGEYCEWCEDRGADEHLAPMEDTWENRLRVVADRMVAGAEVQLDRLARTMRDELGPRGAFAQRTDRALVETFETACRAFEPGISTQYLWDLRNGRPRGGSRRQYSLDGALLTVTVSS